MFKCYLKREENYQTNHISSRKRSIVWFDRFIVMKNIYLTEFKTFSEIVTYNESHERRLNFHNIKLFFGVSTIE